MRSFAMMGFIALSMTAPTLAQFSINEIRTGSDPNEYVEIKGTPGASLAGVTFIIIGDGTTTGHPTRTGVVEWKCGRVQRQGRHWPQRLPGAAQPIHERPGGGPTGHRPVLGSANWLRHHATGFESSDNQTYMLVMDYSGTDTFQGRAPNQGSGGQDLDTNDDGTLDVTPWSSVIDSVAPGADARRHPAGWSGLVVQQREGWPVCQPQRGAGHHWHRDRWLGLPDHHQSKQRDSRSSEPQYPQKCSTRTLALARCTWTARTAPVIGKPLS